MTKAPDELTVGGTVIPRGERRRLDLPVARLPTGTWLGLPVEVVNGKRPGPRLFLTAAVHGDELGGMEIVRRVLWQLDPARMAGAVFAVPVVNVFGFIQGSRYLPDRRDLNRSFPGSKSGSLAARLADILMREIVAPATHGIDLHTGSNHRTNLPQIRADCTDDETRKLSLAFRPSIIVNASPLKGTLRGAACARGRPTLLYEAGEALRFDEDMIRSGVMGVLRVMRTLRMRGAPPKSPRPTEIVNKTTWARARRTGVLRLRVGLGARVARGEQIGVIADTFGDVVAVQHAPASGLVIGLAKHPLVHQGEAIVHVGVSA